MKILAYIAAYLLVGLLIELRRAAVEFDVATLFLWPFGIDVQVKAWFELRRIRRDGARRIAEACAERDKKLRLVEFKWTGRGTEALVTVDYGGKIDCWRGTCTVWRNMDGDRAATWMENWLADRWAAARAAGTDDAQEREIR